MYWFSTSDVLNHVKLSVSHLTSRRVLRLAPTYVFDITVLAQTKMFCPLIAFVTLNVTLRLDSARTTSVNTSNRKQNPTCMLTMQCFFYINLFYYMLLWHSIYLHSLAFKYVQCLIIQLRHGYVQTDDLSSRYVWPVLMIQYTCTCSYISNLKKKVWLRTF